MIFLIIFFYTKGGTHCVMRWEVPGLIPGRMIGNLEIVGLPVSIHLHSVGLGSTAASNRMNTKEFSGE